MICPQCKKEMEFNYRSDKVLDLEDRDFLKGCDVTDSTTVKELKEIEYQPAELYFCTDCEIDVVISRTTAYQDKPPEPPEEQPEPPTKEAEEERKEQENYYWREYTTPCLISRLHDKLHQNYATGLPMAEGTLEDCRNIVNIIMERQHFDPDVCDHKYEWYEGCGAYVCTKCNDHKGLARCYCGWGLAPGERLEDDVEY